MAIIKKNELNGLSLKDIEIKLNELKLELMKQRNEKGGKSLKIREIRKTIAKLLTLKNKLNKIKEQTKLLKPQNLKNFDGPKNKKFLRKA